MNNPMQIINQFKSFMSGYKGQDPRAEALQKIQNSGMSQQQLDKLQQDANTIYSMCKNMGLIK